MEDGVEDNEEVFEDRAGGDGLGSVDVHWDTDFLPGELMNFRLDTRQGAPPLSAVSIQSLADLQYNVNSSKADPYSLPDVENLRNGGTRGRKKAEEEKVEYIEFYNDIPKNFVPIELTIEV